LHNAFKRNVNSQDFPLGGDLHKSVQQHANQELNKIEGNIQETNDAAFNTLAKHKIETNDRVGHNYTYSPVNAAKTLANKRSHPLYASDPSLNAHHMRSNPINDTLVISGHHENKDNNEMKPPQGYNKS